MESLIQFRSGAKPGILLRCRAKCIMGWRSEILPGATTVVYSLDIITI